MYKCAIKPTFLEKRFMKNDVKIGDNAALRESEGGAALDPLVIS